MNIIGQRLHARRKPLWIGDDVALIVSADLPAIIDDYVLIASVFHASADHRIGHLFDQVFTDVAAEFVPTVPSHRRSFGNTVIQRECLTSRKETDREQTENKTTNYFKMNSFHR